MILLQGYAHRLNGIRSPANNGGGIRCGIPYREIRIISIVVRYLQSADKDGAIAHVIFQSVGSHIAVIFAVVSKNQLSGVSVLIGDQTEDRGNPAVRIVGIHVQLQGIPGLYALSALKELHLLNHGRCDIRLVGFGSLVSSFLLLILGLFLIGRRRI